MVYEYADTTKYSFGGKQKEVQESLHCGIYWNEWRNQVEKAFFIFFLSIFFSCFTKLACLTENNVY